MGCRVEGLGFGVAFQKTGLLQRGSGVWILLREVPATSRGKFFVCQTHPMMSSRTSSNRVEPVLLLVTAPRATGSVILQMSNYSRRSILSSSSSTHRSLSCCRSPSNSQRSVSSSCSRQRSRSSSSCSIRSLTVVEGRLMLQLHWIQTPMRRRSNGRSHRNSSNSGSGPLNSSHRNNSQRSCSHRSSSSRSRRCFQRPLVRTGLPRGHLRVSVTLLLPVKGLPHSMQPAAAAAVIAAVAARVLKAAIAVVAATAAKVGAVVTQVCVHLPSLQAVLLLPVP